MSAAPEVWLRGALPGYEPLLMPAAHAFLQAREDIERAAAACKAIDRALEQLRRTTRESLLEPRAVGRARLPSTVLGLIFHAAEHTTRHVGQLITTLKVVRGSVTDTR